MTLPIFRITLMELYSNLIEIKRNVNETSAFIKDTIIVDESNSEYKKSGPVPDNCEYATLRTFRLENATLTLVSEPEPISKQKVALKFGGNKIITYLCSRNMMIE